MLKGTVAPLGVSMCSVTFSKRSMSNSWPTLVRRQIFERAVYRELIISCLPRLASTLTFQFTPFDGTTQVTRFDLRGLDSHLHKLAETCGWAYE